MNCSEHAGYSALLNTGYVMTTGPCRIPQKSDAKHRTELYGRMGRVRWENLQEHTGRVGSGDSGRVEKSQKKSGGQVVWRQVRWLR